MAAAPLAVHDTLAESRRLAITTPGTRPSTWELGALLTIGIAAGLALSFVKLNLRIPGHAILLTVAPLALGLALVPRRWAGSTMSGAAGLTMLAAGHTGAGAVASMLVTGLFLDLALRNARGGVRLYAAFIAAGLAGNAVAFGVRGVTKIVGLDPGTALFSSWWSHALVSYALCGAFTGLVCAALLFGWRKKTDS
jgi:hypothetical protein